MKTPLLALLWPTGMSASYIPISDVAEGVLPYALAGVKEARLREPVVIAFDGQEAYDFWLRVQYQTTHMRGLWYVLPLGGATALEELTAAFGADNDRVRMTTALRSPLRKGTRVLPEGRPDPYPYNTMGDPSDTFKLAHESQMRAAEGQRR